ncbi:putative mucin TcMUCII [Trypanosoma cruzi]|nr:putative mucin TcMUCII [Trypanosoma cruzi]
MMMTCRLLCALLVLALCCCPSVCVAETPEITADAEVDAEPTVTATVTLSPVRDTETIQVSGAILKSASPSSLPQEKASRGDGESEPPGPGSVAEPRRGAGAGKRLTGTSQADGNDGTTGSQGSTGQPADQANGNAEGGVDTTTTTTTTKAPTTTTTTAPEAPSTTTTEAPAVSTTRAPSRLREIDGSLSSSAWVCAPLVLAASALAYTSVG